MNAIQQALDCLKNGNRTWEAMEILEKALAASKPNPSADDIHSCGPFCTRPGCVADREAAQTEQQAQAGEPEFVALLDQLEDARIEARTHDTTVGAAIGKAIEWMQAHREALAQHRAALEECVEALKLAMHWAGPAMERDMRSPSNSQWMVEKTQAQEDSIYAAITYANQVLEGGGK